MSKWSLKVNFNDENLNIIRDFKKDEELKNCLLDLSSIAGIKNISICNHIEKRVELYQLINGEYNFIISYKY